MRKYQLAGLLAVIGIFFLAGFACQKKGDFIDEDHIGNGMHFYPVILNKSLTDTFTHRKLADMKASPGQKIAFQLKYRSKDSIRRIELWEKYRKDSQKVWETDFDSSFYSRLQNSDTTYITYEVPDKTEDTSSFKLLIIPKVVSKKGLKTRKEATLTVK